MNFCLIGYPLGHSMSEYIHKQLFEYSGYDGSYSLLPTPPEQLDVRDIMKRYCGINVTIPHKTAVIHSLDALSGYAEILQSVNTIALENGLLIGYNTDYEGFRAALAAAGVSVCGKRVLVCGGGGTARMMLADLARQGANVSVLVRQGSRARAQQLIDETLKRVSGASIKLFDDNESEPHFELIANATPLGMYPDNINSMAVSERLVASCSAVFDAVYNPRETLLVKTARRYNKTIAYGMTMLVYQAAAAHRIWYGASFSDEFLDNLTDKTNQQLKGLSN